MVVTGRRVRLTAILVGVVLALTGFSSTGGSSGGSGSGKSKSGGGCSSSKSKPKKKSTGSGGGSGSGGSSASPTPTATRPAAHAEVVTCAGPGRAKATVKVTSDVSAGYTFRVPLVFEGAAGRVDAGSVDVELKGGESRTVEVPMTSADKAGDVRTCVVGRIETKSSSSSGSTTSGSGSASTSGTTSGSGSTGSGAHTPDGKSTSSAKPKSKSPKRTH